MDFDPTNLFSDSATPPTTQDESGNYTVPAYLIAADNHNYGNGNAPWYDPTTWADKAMNVGKFTAVSLASGLNSFYNTGAAVANWFGADVQQNDVATQLSELDDDLGQYYKQNRQAADLVGFIATSLLPGTAGVKILDAGQAMLGVAKAGYIGTNMGRALGLLSPDVAKLTQVAAVDLAKSQSTFSFINSSVARAIGAGAGQQALEWAAFETAVQATMFKSPVLDQQDTGDIVKNILTSAALGGTIGGAFTAAKSYYGIKKLVSSADVLEKPFTSVSEFPGASAAESAISRSADLDAMKAIEIPEYASKFTDLGISAQDAEAKLTRLAGTKENKLYNLQRQDIQSMVLRGDSDLGNMVADSLVGLPADQVTNNLFGATAITRVGINTPIETTIKKAVKALSPESVNDLKVGYVKMVGDGAGNLTFTPPNVLNLADNYKSVDAMMQKVKSYGFKTSVPYDLANVGDHYEAEARYLWADNLQDKVFKPGMVIHENDIPLMERALADGFSDFKLQAGDGSLVPVNSTQDLFENLTAAKDRLNNQFVMGKKFTTEEAAKVTNTKLSYVEGEKSYDIVSDLLARQDYAKQYTDMMVKKGLWNPSKGLIDISTKPSWMKITYDTSAIKDVNPNVLDAMSYIKANQKLYQQGVSNITGKYFGDLASRFVHPDEQILTQTNRFGSSPGLMSSTNGGYGTAESWAQQIGAASHDLRTKFVKDTNDVLESSAYKLANNPKAAIEFEAIKNKVAATTEKYVLNEDGTALVSRNMQEYRDAIAAGEKADAPILQQGAPEEIPIQYPETMEAIQNHIDRNGRRVTGFQELRSAQGLENGKDADTFYPWRPDPNKFKHFVFVVDPSVTGVGHVSMIHAATAADLELLVAKIPDNYKWFTKEQTAEYHEALGDFDYERSLHENYIDADLKRRGINTPFFTQTDPQKIVQEWLESHQRAENVFARELVSAEYEKEFAELRRLGDQYTNLSSSKYGSSNVRLAENVAKNPYLSYVKTALDISQASEYPLIRSFNELMDKSFSRATNAIKGVWDTVKSPQDLDTINSALKENGVQNAYYDAALNAFVNHTAPQGALKTFVSRANNILATFMIGTDPLNAINRMIGHEVLTRTEAQSVINGIKAGNPEVAGKLAQLSEITVPGTNDSILSPTKLIASSMGRYFDKSINESLFNEYKLNGWLNDTPTQFQSVLDDLTLKGTESSGELSQKINAAFAKAKDLTAAARKYSGNDFSTAFTQFIAADVMKQISDLGVEAGVLTKGEQTSYINTFVNRTQGNMLASQRPLMFQGPVGQAVSLFQTYQMNMMQQLLRYVGEGTSKDAAMALGMQGTIYGLGSLPAFNFINQHIVGTASGNPNHRDLYDATYGIAGKQLGDWLMYGAASNLLKTDIYSRGHMNPHQLTVIPTNPADVPVINAIGGFFGNLKDTVTKLAQGGNVWETLLQGLEHNSISRPLAGLAQTLQSTTGNGQVFSTDKHGNIMGANDLFSLATLSRLAGGHPLDEALTRDAAYRVSAYQAADHAKVEGLDSAIKSTLIEGQQPSIDQMQKFSSEYAAYGGNQLQFNKHVMSMYQQANTAQANKIAEHLSSPFAQKMQTVMGGNAIQDGHFIPYQQ